MRIFWDNLIDDAAGAVSSEEVEFPGSYVRNAHQTQVWKTTGDSGIADEYYRINSASTNKRACIILNHDLDASDTIKVQGNATDSWSTPTVNEVITHAAGTMIETFALSTLQYFRLMWTKDTATDVYEIGRVFIGDYHETETQPAYDGYRPGYRARDLAGESYGGQVYTIERAKPRTVSVSFEAVTQTQIDAFLTIFAAVGTHTPFFIQIDPDATGWLLEPLYVRFLDSPKPELVGVDSELRYDVTLDMEEAL